MDKNEIGDGQAHTSAAHCERVLSLLRPQSIPDTSAISEERGSTGRHLIINASPLLPDVGTSIAARLVAGHCHPQSISSRRHSQPQFQFYTFHPRYQGTECLRAICVEITSPKTCILSYHKKSCQCSLIVMGYESCSQIPPHRNKIDTTRYDTGTH